MPAPSLGESDLHLDLVALGVHAPIVFAHFIIAHARDLDTGRDQFRVFVDDAFGLAIADQDA
jgi:hypothetical protein